MNTIDTYKLPKTLIIDYNTWRCGGITEVLDNCHGKGSTELLNSDGYMCCLGQFSCQAGVPKQDLLNSGVPADMHDVHVIGLTKLTGDSYIEHNKITGCAIDINDSEDTTIATKVKKLRRLFGKSHYKIRLVNFPKAILDEINGK